jgi:hypothetical protein
LILDVVVEPGNPADSERRPSIRRSQPSTPPSTGVLARKTGAGALRRPMLVALGLRHDGKKEVIVVWRAAKAPPNGNAHPYSAASPAKAST